MVYSLTGNQKIQKLIPHIIKKKKKSDYTNYIKKNQIYIHMKKSRLSGQTEECFCRTKSHEKLCEDIKISMSTAGHSYHFKVWSFLCCYEDGIFQTLHDNNIH